ncbi:hypothetical protein PHLCEN_2v13196 [Hermanssonia centrifuga]|uniref:Uncharacterized protein n=1 Tax=Hermanssonia centrifuga TaxID=98765 RepID=A0A2R6NEW1_9APHY|nr:hypothetical protein PHLCEN_2v13196 [Hermanssonia centrifuga]
MEMRLTERLVDSGETCDLSESVPHCLSGGASNPTDTPNPSSVLSPTDSNSPSVTPSPIFSPSPSLTPSNLPTPPANVSQPSGQNSSTPSNSPSNAAGGSPIPTPPLQTSGSGKVNLQITVMTAGQILFLNGLAGIVLHLSMP